MNKLHHYHHVGRFLVIRFLHSHFQPPSLLPSTAHGSQKRDRGEHPNSMLSKSRPWSGQDFNGSLGVSPIACQPHCFRRDHLAEQNDEMYLQTLTSPPSMHTIFRQRASCSGLCSSNCIARCITRAKKVEQGRWTIPTLEIRNKTETTEQKQNNNTTNLLLGEGIEGRE